MATVRPQFGPTLPTLLRRRFGVPPAITVAVAAVLGAAAAVAVVVVITRPPAPGDQLVYEQGPVFNLLHPPETLPRATARTGELVRLQARRGRFTVSVVVRPLRLPPYRGDVTHGQLPVYADGFADDLRARLPGFVLREEGRARVNNAVGYEIGFQAAGGGRHVTGRDVLLTSDEPDAPGLVVLSLRSEKAGRRMTASDRQLTGVARKAYRSFRFGTERG